MTESLIEWDALDLRDALHQRRISAVELAEAFLDRIDACNDAVNAVVSLRPRDEILAEAEQMDRTNPAGPLYGLPVAIKDLVDTRNLRSTQGSPIFAEHLPQSDHLLAARIREAGALIIGKTNTPEFGLGSHSYNPVFGVTRNPYDLSRSAGGSSGGAAAALAARMVPIADGSDMMGSLRNPAGWNNVYGLRPSFGLVPDEPVGDNFLHQLATLGPMARSPADLGLLLGVIGRPHPRHPHARSAFAGLGPTRPMRIGWIGDWAGYYPMQAGIKELCEQALGVFSDLGHDVVQLIPDFPPERLWESWITLRSWQTAMRLRPHYEDPQKRALLKPEAIWEIERGLALSASDIHDASIARSDWFTAFAEMADIDILALPSAQIFPFEPELDWPKEIAGRPMDTYHRWMEIVLPASLIGVPGLCVPAGFGQQGLPMGLQLIARRGEDGMLLGLGQSYHGRTLWPQKRPPDVSTMSARS